MMHETKIRVFKVRLLENGQRDLKAFVDIEADDWIIHGFRVQQQGTQKLSVLPPQSSWKDPSTGEIRFKGILTIPPEQKQRIDVAILHAYQEEKEKRYGKPPR